VRKHEFNKIQKEEMREGLIGSSNSTGRKEELKE
jgi:hypothetical protein